VIVPNNHLHYNPYPNVTGPGQPDLCEAGNEDYVKGKAQIGHASEAENNREFTSREDNLAGEKYPETTLKALGVAKPPAKAKAKAKSKKKGKGK
jgi:hypothetical protein